MLLTLWLQGGHAIQCLVAAWLKRYAGRRGTSVYNITSWQSGDATYPWPPCEPAVPNCRVAVVSHSLRGRRGF